MSKGLDGLADPSWPTIKLQTPARVLIVDDEPTIVILLTRFLNGLGYSTSIARNGREALDVVPTVKPDLLLLDIDMPVLDGLAVCRLLREDFRTRGLPIMLLTGKQSPEDRIRGYKLGIDDYITKPYDLEELRVRIEGVLERRRWDQGTHPLTHLPGSPGIEEEVAKWRASGAPFAFAYIDIDYFKAYNDAYGYESGDRVIKTLSQCLIDASLGDPRVKAFPGHIGGDDFVFISTIDHMKKVLPQVAQEFDSKRRSFYSESDYAQGKIQCRSRTGAVQDFPLITLSVAVIRTDHREIPHYARLAEIASELKKYVKGIDHLNKSLVLWDRRKDPRDNK